MAWRKALTTLLSVTAQAQSPYELQITTSPYALTVRNGSEVLVQNTQVLAGSENITASAISANADGTIANNGGFISASFIKPHVIQVTINSTSPFTGATFSDADPDTEYFGTWEYPWNGSLTNRGVNFDLKGVGNADGINWCNARAQFFISQRGYAVYADTLQMGYYQFSDDAADARFVFNTSSLNYYIILPHGPRHFKSLLSEYTALSAAIEIPPLSGLGPTFWSDDFRVVEREGVRNDQENVLDVVDNLRTNRIRASSIFFDRPYGSGNLGFGNFDFNTTGYPDAEGLIRELNETGFDVQVWVANRAFEGNQLFNISTTNNWLFDGNAAQGGPALDLTIPAAYTYWKSRLQVFPQLGIRGYKIDRGEEEEMPVYAQNIQMTLYIQLLYENMIEAWGSSKEFYNFARSAVDRSRKHTHIWNGDALATTTGLGYSILSGIRAGLVGFPVWGSDTGGYVRDSSVGPFAPTADLWARWMWFSAFSPVYEIPVGVGKTPWYEPYISQTPELLTVLRQTCDLHSQLIPYIISYTRVAQRTGVPIIRAPFLEAPFDTSAYTNSAAEPTYFFGDAFYIAPLLSTGERGTSFPNTNTDQSTPTRYLEYFDKTLTYSSGIGNGTRVDRTLSEPLPVYVRPGAIVPKGDILAGNVRSFDPSTPWTPYVDIELFPSSQVGETTFEYYNTETDTDSHLVLNVDGARVTFKYGGTGYPGKAIVYARGGALEQDLAPGGGELVWEGVEVLF